jgi:hypothetical protein
MNLSFVEINRNEYSYTVMEDCIYHDLGMKYDFDSRLAENTVRNNWDSLVRICHTVDGHQIGGINAMDMDDPEYCIVYASKVYKQVISKIGSITVKTDVEYWDEINKALYRYFFK